MPPKQGNDAGKAPTCQPINPLLVGGQQGIPVQNLPPAVYQQMVAQTQLGILQQKQQQAAAAQQIAVAPIPTNPATVITQSIATAVNPGPPKKSQDKRHHHQAPPAPPSSNAAPSSKKRKAADIRLDALSPFLIPESPLFNQVLATEKRIDTLIKNKQLEIAEMASSFRSGEPGTIAAMASLKKRLRMYIFHTRRNTATTGNNSNSNSTRYEQEPESFSLHIQGRLLDGEGPHPPSSTGKNDTPRQPFSHYIKSIKIELYNSDNNEGDDKKKDKEDDDAHKKKEEHHHQQQQHAIAPPPSETIIWEKASHLGDIDHRESFEIRRLGQGPSHIKLWVEIDHSPQLYIVSSELAELLGLDQTRLHSVPNTLHMMWGYVKANALFEASLDDEEKDGNGVKEKDEEKKEKEKEKGKEEEGTVVGPTIKCNDALKRVLGINDADGGTSIKEEEKEQRFVLTLEEVQQGLKRHFTPPLPALIEYQVRLDGPSPSRPACYDFEVEVPLSQDLPPFMSRLKDIEKEVGPHNNHMKSLLGQIQERRRRRNLYLSFSESPHEFITGLAMAQGRDLRVVHNKEGESLEVMAGREVHKEPWVEDAVLKYLQSRAMASQEAAVNQ